MDSPIVTRLFRQLFRHGHPACHARRNLTNLATALHNSRQRHQLGQSRGLSSFPFGSNDDKIGRGAVSQSEKERGWQQRNNAWPKDRTLEAQRYPTVTARDLRSYKERPRRVKMLMRDFIDGQELTTSTPSVPPLPAQSLLHR